MAPKRKVGRKSNAEKRREAGLARLAEEVPNLEELLSDGPRVASTVSAVPECRIHIPNGDVAPVTGRLPAVLSHPLCKVVRAIGAVKRRLDPVVADYAASFWNSCKWKTSSKQSREESTGTSRRQTTRMDTRLGAATELAERDLAETFQDRHIIGFSAWDIFLEYLPTN